MSPLTCPAYVQKCRVVKNATIFNMEQCAVVIDLEKYENNLDAEYQMLQHIQMFHTRWWSRHGKARTIRLNRRVAMARTKGA